MNTNSDVVQISSKSTTSKQNIPTDTQSDLHLSTENITTALEQLVTSNSIENSIAVFIFKDQITRLNAKIKALKTFFLEQIFVGKKSLKERH